MFFNRLTKKVEELHLKGEHQEIIELIEHSKDRKAEHISLLARAYQNLENPDFMKAYELLMSCEEELANEESFNFRMGYNLYYRDIISKAIWYFENVLAINSASSYKDDTLHFIDDCKKRMALGVTDITLNERANNFWSDFMNDDTLHELLASDDMENALSVIERIQTLLQKNSLYASIEVGMGKHFERPHIILSPEGMFFQLVIYQQILSFIPDEVKENYDFSIGRTKATSFGFKMNGVELNKDNVELAYSESDGRFDVYLKHDDLLQLYANDEDSALHMAYVFIDSFFGELFCMRHISSVNIADKKELEYRPIVDVIDELLDQFKGESYEDYPYNSYTSYSLGDVEKIEKVRDDILAGTTCLSPIIRDYLSGQTDTFDTSFDSGAVYVSFIFDIGDMAPKDALTIRHDIEDVLQEKQSTIFRIIGGAFGVYSMYSDFLVFDMKEFKNSIVDLYICEAKKRGVKNAYFATMRAGSEVFSLFDDTEE